LGRKKVFILMHNVLIRIFDIVFSLIGLAVGLPVIVILALIGFLDTGSPIFKQKRVGLNKKPFTLIKFRTMKKGTAQVGSHMVSRDAITKFGVFLRSSKLDELPQLWNVLTGDMSLVGPRPCLFSQHELIYQRERRGVFTVRPGITGLAQISQIDMSTPELLAYTDDKMIKQQSVGQYFKLILTTLTGAGAGDAVSK
jgi:lipopolysaccharide/colanic/teichoic acid biosynthesis glycosyltransferase